MITFDDHVEIAIEKAAVTLRRECGYDEPLPVLERALAMWLERCHEMIVDEMVTFVHDPFHVTLPAFPALLARVMRDEGAAS